MKYYDEQLWYEFMWWWMMMKWCGMMIDRRYPFCQSAGGSLPSASSLSEGPSPKKCIVMVTKLGGLSGLRVCPQRLFPRNHQVWIFRNRWLRAMFSESWWDLGSCRVVLDLCRLILGQNWSMTDCSQGNQDVAHVPNSLAFGLRIADFRKHHAVDFLHPPVDLVHLCMSRRCSSNRSRNG